ncbi:uncharacterized protein LOC113502415 [Trichoplusia ni]|uniref:Uncharacterized protein LOC113502415 n=1 Tax=Trichoplusia ni TaxID=7111 RepID=A0A7E5WGE2_TRINI|nr:uncharacterized protein LOC113502415 [Trichoplusia ni]
MDLLQPCVNCGITIRERIRRHVLSSLPPDMTVLLSEWLTFELSSHSHVCGACYDNLSRCLATNSRERQLGHINICYGCGKSVTRARRHEIVEGSPLASLVSLWHHHVRAANFLCHGCYMRANREVSRRNITDSNRFDALEDHQTDQNIQIPIPPPLPPPLPPQLPPPLAPHLHLGQGQDVSSIALPNYRRCANTSRRCIFDGCQQSAGHLVPTLIKSALLFHNKLYVPRCARICENHLHSNEWELLLENSSLTNTFTALEIENLLDSKNVENVIDFENIDLMPNHVCHHWTGRTTQEFIELHNSIPIQSVVPKNSKSALAMLLIKYRTGDSDARISSFFRIAKSTLQYKMNLVRNCLTDHFVPLHLGVSHISHQEIVARNTTIPEKLFGNPHSDASDGP